MKITIEIDDGALRENVQDYNESVGAKRGDISHVTCQRAKAALRSHRLREALVERALELATESTADMLRP